MTRVNGNGTSQSASGQDTLRHLTEGYLRSVICEAGTLTPLREFSSSTPFGELGINSFGVLKVIKSLEADFGTLRKSLLFEHFNLDDLTDYFVREHQGVLTAKFAGRMQPSTANGNGHKSKSAEQMPRAEMMAPAKAKADVVPAGPICMLEVDARRHTGWGEVVKKLFELHKSEGSVSRGTRKIAPYVFLGSERRGYFNYGRSRNILLVYGYTGPREYAGGLTEEMYRYCQAHSLQLNILADEAIPPVGPVTFTTTPFGVLQRIHNLGQFTLEGGSMRRLRYQVSKFEKSGVCRTVEYVCGSNHDTDSNIVSLIDRWSATKEMVNPLVRDVRREIEAGRLSSEHRLFLTWLDDVLQNAVLITSMSSSRSAYLMDLEFYPPEMPLGGLEYAITQMISVLAAEGCEVLSLGGTYGCKLAACANADPEVDRILDELREQKIFNDEGNLQFKNKFRPENRPVFLCRAAGSGNANNVIDIIMMIADPERSQADFDLDSAGSASHLLPEGKRWKVLEGSGFNPLNIADEYVECDLKTDSWSQLNLPAIVSQLAWLRTQVQQPVHVEARVKAIFSFPHVLLTGSGQQAEHLFFKAWQRKGTVLENLLFPSTIFHQIDNGFSPREIPHPGIFDVHSNDPAKAGLAWDRLREELGANASGVALVCVEVGNNASGGTAVWLRHLKEVKELLRNYAIPLVLDVTRVVENARLLIEQEEECKGRSTWTVVTDILAQADAVIGSLTKDFCVNKGGIIATRDEVLFRRLRQLVQEEGSGIDVIDKKLIGLALQKRDQVDAQVQRRIESVRRVGQALQQYAIPLVNPVGGHCVLVDAKRIPAFSGFRYPAASFISWLYLNTGIRAAAHSVGMQQSTPINELVRLAIPVGLKREQIDELIAKLGDACKEIVNIPEVILEAGTADPREAVYKLVNFHKPVPTVAKEKQPASDAEPCIAEPGLEEGGAGNQPSISATGPARTLDRLQQPAFGLEKPEHLQDIAVVGMAGRYPKAKNTRELWQNLVRGLDCIEDLPEQRYEERLRHGEALRYRGGFIADMDRFDSLFFNISPREAEMLDPQERQFLEVAWEVMEDAGYYPESFAEAAGRRSVGVFVGAVWSMYQMLAVEEKHAGQKIVPNSFLWSIANRVSYCFNFTGPSLTVDTACSSSLTAIYLACQAIHAGDCTAAIAGGVNLDIHQAKFDINQAGGALSPDGVCRTFGNGANGYVAGEGVGALLLKPLGRAVEDGDHIYGIIRSAVVNHGGRGSGYTVPNPKAQGSLIQAALDKAGVHAETIGYIEAHGTGTELGDPIEIAGLNQAFTDLSGSQSCAIGSVKSNIGHLEAAAGIAGVSKVLLQMQQRQLAPSLHSAELNGFIDFKRSAFYVVQRAEEWLPRQLRGVACPLRAGVSSFGAGGSNAHVILEEYVPTEEVGLEELVPDRWVFPLSAKSESQLREAASRLLAYLKQGEWHLQSVAHTLQAGRKSFEERLAIIAATREELLEKLTCFLEGRRSEGIVQGQVNTAERLTRLLSRAEKLEVVRILSQGGDAERLAELWVEGLVTDWAGIPSGKRISLPTYPFAGKRYWAGMREFASPLLPAVTGLHPLIDSNESTFERQVFRKTFSRRDFVIYDHLVAGTPTLPGVAYLELARKAGEIAAGRKVQKIRNILWVSPIVVRESAAKEVFVELKPVAAEVRFEVFSHDEQGSKALHSQGLLVYATDRELDAEPEFINIEAVRARCAKVIDGERAYPLFKSFGLDLGPSFQVLQDVYKNDEETLGVLRLPGFRRPELEQMMLHPSLVDGSLQAGMGAQLGENVKEMFVPFSIGEVEVLQPLAADCYSFVTEAKPEQKQTRDKSKVFKSDVTIADATGKVLVRIRESIGVPLREVQQKQDAGDVSTLHYGYEWEPAALPSPLAVESGPLLLFGNDQGLHSLYSQRAGAGRATLVFLGEDYRAQGEGVLSIHPRSKADFDQLFNQLATGNIPVETICFALGEGSRELDDRLVAAHYETVVFPFLFLCQVLVQRKLESAVQLLYVYTATESHAHPLHDAMRGFVNTVRLEHPKLLCKTIEVQQSVRDDSGILDAILTEAALRTNDASAVRYQGPQRSIKKLKQVAAEAVMPASLRRHCVVLITGGAGGLGLVFAAFLAREFHAKLILTGRSPLSSGQQAQLESIRQMGAEVLYLTGDVSNLEDVERVAEQGRKRFGPIHGVIHSAGVLRDSLLRNKTVEEMSAVLAPKVYGTLHLDQATSADPLDFFVTFSSLAAVTGNAGQCDYSFANHFMDSFAAQRERRREAAERSGKTLSINWSLWADGGMKLDAQTELYFRKTLGIQPLSIATGMKSFVQLLGSARTQAAVVEGDQEKIETAWGLRKKKAAGVPQTMAASPQGSNEGVSAGAAGQAFFPRLRTELSQMVIDFLKLDPGDMSTEKILLDLGFDSMGLTSFANQINDRYKLDITPVLFFDYPSVNEIARYLAVEREGELASVYGAASPAAAQQSPRREQQTPVATGDAVRRKNWDPSLLQGAASAVAAAKEFSAEGRFQSMPIAIVGMSGVMPQSDDLDVFWENLRNGKDMVTVIPEDRWRWEEFYGDPLTEVNKSNSKWGGFMNHVDKFDPLFFGISPREAQAMDPQQRLFLQTVWKTIEDSGHKVSDFSGTRTGIFVGVATNDYVDVMNSQEIALDGYSASGNSHSVLANRISFLLNLRGPSAPIDTACSSSLVALHRAIESIHTGSCDMALVGGVQVMLSPAAYISFGMAGMLSGDGRCKSFDKAANGYVRGEGCGAILIKPLAVAERDGDHIYAVIKATAENHGGRVTTLTAPNSQAQSALLVEAYEKARVDPVTVGYIECHGTGTPLGDPVEIQALIKAFAELYKRGNKPAAQSPHCGLSSVKTNIGHLETAAGIAGLLKALLAIQHREIPANVHFEELNPFIQLKGSPFYIADKLVSWPAPVGPDGMALPRRAGVSSFGFGGANAHIVLEEYMPTHAQKKPEPGQPRMVVLSAKNEERLEAYMQSLHAWLGKEEREDLSLEDLAYTLHAGRDEMAARVALVVASIGELRNKLDAILNRGEKPHGCFQGNAREKAAEDAPLLRLIEEGNLHRVAELWVAGASVDCRSLYDTRSARRMSLPTYPFARERHWISGSVRRKQAVGDARLHPLIHQNVSTLREQKFHSRFSGEEFYLADHVVGTQKILPGMAYLEMARAAGEHSAGNRVRTIRDLIWHRPLIINGIAAAVETAITPVGADVAFSIRTFDHERPLEHCTGRLAYEPGTGESDILDLDGILARCSEQIVTGTELYPILSNSGLHLGTSFRIVERMFANPAESLALLKLPEHLESEAEQFLLHPALMDGALHTGIGLMKKSGIELPLSIPYSVREVQILDSLKDLHYGYATWAIEDPLANQNSLKVNFDLLDKRGKVLVRIRDYVSRPVPGAAAGPAPHEAAPSPIGLIEHKEGLQRFKPTWQALTTNATKKTPSITKRVALLNGDPEQLDWVRMSYRDCRVVSCASTDVMAQGLTDPFDTLLWIAPDASSDFDQEQVIEQQKAGVVALFRCVKALQQAGFGGTRLQWTMVTRSALRVTETDKVYAAHAGVTGFAGSLSREYPHWDVRVLDVESLASVTSAECLSLPWDGQASTLAHRNGQWWQPALTPLPASLEATAPFYRREGVYVVIGGAGGLGEVWTRFLMERYQATVFWIGRRAYDATIEARINASTRLGRAPHYICADATHRQSLQEACQNILAIVPAIHGVVHSAVVLRDQSLARMEEADFQAALAAKVDITVHMDQVFGQQPLDFMLFFSSVISFFQTPGQANYAAGSTFQDSFAQQLQQRRPYPVKVINWGYWGSVGAVADDFHRNLMAQNGIGSIEPEEGMVALESFAHSPLRQMVLVKTHSKDSLKRLQEGVAPLRATASAASSAQRQPAEDDEHIKSVIVEKLSQALKLDAAVIRNDASFADYGVDSITGVSLVRAISANLAIELDGAKLFEYSTVNQLAGYIAERRQPAAAATTRSAPTLKMQAPTTAGKGLAVGSTSRFLPPSSSHVKEVSDSGPKTASSTKTDRIAIIGMSGRFAESESLEAFWQNLQAGKDLVKPVSRWSAADCVMGRPNGHKYCAHGSFIESADQFDPSFFGISPVEAVYMDPQQRLFLEESWKALEDAGYACDSIREKQCGVYVGCGSSGYDRLFGEQPPPQAWWGNSQSVAPARIAYYLNLQGPAISVDTACSSSLVAIHLACQGLWAGETEMALAGGVYVQATPGFHQVANLAGMLSPDGKCYSFDARANGFVPGEGVGVVVLKRLADSLRDGDHIYAVIAGSGINQNGGSNGLVAPNARAQERLEHSVYERFQISPETIQMVEAHGTATTVGDSIEYGAISRVFASYTNKKQFCAIGSAKTNVGHGAAVAGVTGVLKVLLSLQHEQIPPTLHFKSNPAIDFASGPFYVNCDLKPWNVEESQKRRGAVSSFGFSGTNGHLVLEEPPSVERDVPLAPAYLVVLSAKSSAQVKQQVQNLLSSLRTAVHVSMNDLSFSLFVGRMHLPHRLACLAENQKELISLLEKWLARGTASQIYTAELPEGRVREQVSLKKFGNYCIAQCADVADAEVYLENLAAVAELYVQGYALDFAALFPAGSRRIPLPTYPFARESYWITDSRTATQPPFSESTQPSSSVPFRQEPAVAEMQPLPTLGADEKDLFPHIQDELVKISAAILQRGAEDLPTERVLLDLGFDSLALTSFADAINHRYQLDITPVLFFEHSSIAELARYFAVECADDIRRVWRSTAVVAPAKPAEPARDEIVVAKTIPAVVGQKVVSPAATENRFVRTPIAIVGIGGVMPQCDDLNSFWESLRGGRDLVTVLPRDRWRWEDYYGDPLKEMNKSNSKWGGFMNQVDKFDPSFFGISEREAQAMDPQQRIFLETVWKTIEDSGQKVSDLAGTRTGLFVGVGANDYANVMSALPLALDGYSASGTSHSVLANRVSYLLDLRGPSAPVDTACSSSLVALHRAIESIHSGSCDMAIAGGVHVMLSPAPYIAFGAAGMLSGEGKCRTFDKSANGYVRGEGCGAIFLKPLSAAEADGNPIYAVIKSTAENHGGRVPTMTAPSITAQSLLLIEAYEKAQIDPATVGYIECHGTGTVLGDPIEVQALSKAFATLKKKQPRASTQTARCGLGSVKTNIGHLEAAAGIAGLLKVLLAIRHRQIPASLHFEQLNPYIRLEGTPFYINDRLTPWEAPESEDGVSLPRRAGVSSFGFGGANAHVVLEEYISPARESSIATDQSHLIVLSAKSEKRLHAYMELLRAHLAAEKVPLAELAWTLQVGRDEMGSRIAFVVENVEELKQNLAAALRGEETPEGCYRGDVRNKAMDDARVSPLIRQRDLSRLAELWVSGVHVEWAQLYEAHRPRRISLPGYPFARERHWIADQVEKGRASFPAVVAERRPEAGLQSLLPVWSPLQLDNGDSLAPAKGARILLLGGAPSASAWLAESYPASRHVPLSAEDTSDAIAQRMAESPFDQLFWIAPELGADMDGDLIDAHAAGLRTVFRAVKALQLAGYSQKPLEWTFLTYATQEVIENESIRPEHAGVLGLAGTLAWEYPAWNVRILDLECVRSVTARECLALPSDKRGHIRAYRQGSWFQQELQHTRLPEQAGSFYRSRRVYVVIGGAGGLGEVWTRYVMERYQAEVVWIGRRAYDTTIEAKVKAATRLGVAPRYVSADATNVESLQQACDRILTMYPAIHGVVHSAVVLHDQLLEGMAEPDFRAAVGTKVDIGVNMARVFGGLPLDFMLFFSSTICFFKTPGQSSYAAGSMFEDSFARRLQREAAYPVKLINWGYWGSIGVAGDEIHRRMMAQTGIGSIEPEEGMAALEAYLGTDLRQMVLIKTLDAQATGRLTSTGVSAASVARADVPMPSDQSYVGPRNDIERQLIEISSQLLKLPAEKIGIHHSFFELGGHSLLGTQLLSQIRSRFDVDLPLMALFERSTVAQLAELISETETSKPLVIQPIDRAGLDHLPLSFAQERVWYFDQLEPGTTRYNLLQAVSVREELDVAHLEQAFNFIIARHESLRTIFPIRDGQAQQEVLESLAFKLECLDLTDIASEQDRHKQARQLCQADAATPFDLARGPLLRGRMIKLAERDYVMMLVMHHMVGDGWSLGVLTREFRFAMEALRQGRTLELPPLAIQYADYSVWQRQRLEEGGLLKQQLAYWQQKLANLPESLDLATDYPRPKIRNFAGALHTFTLDSQLVEELKSLAESRGCTTFMILLAVLKVLLFRYSGQADICVGTLIANRQYAETEALIGMFVNTLALRSQVEAEDTFAALLSQVRTTCLEAYDHQDTPFEKVVESLRLSRNPAINPVFQVLTILQNASGEAKNAGFPRYPLGKDISEFDFSMVFSETSAGLNGSIRYSTALFKAQTIERMATHLEALFRAVVAAPTTRIRDLDYLGEAEKHRMLVTYNATQADYPKEKCMHELFADQAAAHPERIAVVCQGEELSYQALCRRSAEVASYLKARGVKPDHVVGLCVERSLTMVVALMAILRAGGACLPLDPAESDEALSHILDDSQTVILLTQNHSLDRLNGLLMQEAVVIDLDAPRDAEAVPSGQAKDASLCVEVQPENASYLLYPAASQEKPRGVLLEHKALVNRIYSLQKRYGLTEDDVVLQKAPYGRDVSVLECFWPLMAGARVVLADAGKHEDVGYLADVIRSEKVTTLHLAPHMLLRFVEEANGACPSVRRILCSGESLDADSVERYQVAFPNASLQYLYSLVEAAIDVASYDCSSLTRPFVPIGKPIHNTQIYILDPYHRPQPMGVAGELHVAGDGLARGYFNSPEWTKRKFIPNPFLPGTRMYKTGERARWLADGNVQYLGPNRASTL